MRLSGGLIGVGLAAALALPGTATAAAPVITSVEPAPDLTTISWSVPPGEGTHSIEVADSPEVTSEGSFLDQHLVSRVLLFGRPELSWKLHIPAGTHYVHVASWGAAPCTSPLSPDCVKNFSATVQVIVPVAPPPPTADVACFDPNAATCLDEFSATHIVVIPEDPKPPPLPKAPDAVAAFTSLLVPAKQRLNRVFVRAGMGEVGTIAATGSIDVPNAARVYADQTSLRNGGAGRDREASVEASGQSAEGGAKGTPAPPACPCDDHDQGQGRRRECRRADANRHAGKLRR
jgi:hypothetical protein